MDSENVEKKTETEERVKIDIASLSADEVKEKTDAGQTNQVKEDLLKSDRQIIQENTINVFNLLNLVLAALVIFVGSPKNALFFGVVIINTCIGVFQELKAKHTIDKLSVLAKAQATVIRDGYETLVDQNEIVLGDTLLLRNGDQIPVDGKIIQTEGLEVDESLLTGESDRVSKNIEDKVFSGSFVTAGTAFYEATAVGKDNFAQKLTQAAKSKKNTSSDLVKILGRMIAVLTVLIVPVGLGMMYSQYLSTDSFKQAVLGTVASLVSMIPEGLMLLTSVAFAVGAANLARRKVLVQSMSSIETLARVDTICLDKTGTITDGTLKFEKAILEKVSGQRFEQIMNALMTQLPDTNATANALRERFKQKSNWYKKKIIPFSSARKWSGVSFEDDGSYVIGAPEFVFTRVPAIVYEHAQSFMEEGYRILVLASYPKTLTTELTEPVELLAILIISDNLRENAAETFGYFEQQDVTLKVISGDHPLTVSKIAQKAGIKDADSYVDMSSLLGSESYQTLARENTVFGRVSPEQKQRLVEALQKQKHTVCMTGDGVNDVLALRQADIGVAMANGSSAARAASDVILLDSDFKKMQDVLKEGRRVINNIERVASMYLVKTIYSVILAVIFMLVTWPYPFEPIQLTPINALTVGIPSFFLALKPSYERIKGDFLNNILRVSVPGAVTVVVGIMLAQLAGWSFNLTTLSTSTISVFFTGCVGLFVLYTVSKPFDQNKVLLIVVMSGLYLACFLVFRDFFNFDQLLDRDLFFVIPLAFGGFWFFNFLTSMMHHVVNWRGRWQRRKFRPFT